MKTIVSFACSFLLLSTTTTIAAPLPQSKAISASIGKFNSFVRFNVHRQQNGVMATWTFSDPGNVASFTIQRSYDGSFFETIGQVPAGERNLYKDESVYPGYLHYRIVAVMNDGSVIYSNVDVVRIVRNG